MKLFTTVRGVRNDGKCRISAALLLAVLLPVLPALAAEPVMESVTWTKRGNEHVTLVDITFTFSDADNDDCWVALWGHDAVTREHFPMQQFVEGNIVNRTFAPGTHTITWIASANAGGRTSDNFQVFARVSDTGRVAAGRYLIIDVSGGPAASNYPIEYADYIDVIQDLYKTDKIVLRELPDGSYAGIFEVTQKQYQNVTGQTPSSFAGNLMHPVETVSWDTLTDRDVYFTGFIGLVRAKAGLTNIGLPTSEAWRYVCRAGATNEYNDYTMNNGIGHSSESAMLNLGWYDLNSDAMTHDVGGCQSNAWGLYDTHGNVSEWLITIWGSSYRTRRGGSWGSTAYQCRSSEETNFYIYPDRDYNYIGFRLVLPILQTGIHPIFTQKVSSSATLGTIVAIIDYNGSGTPDAFEDFNDNGLPDAFEDFNDNGLPDAFEDFNGNGLPDAFEDLGGSGTPDAFGDFNSNGMPDAFEDYNRDDVPDWFEDNDGDGMPDMFSQIYSGETICLSHPESTEWYFGHIFTAIWPAHYPEATGFIYLFNHNSDTVLSMSTPNAYYTEARQLSYPCMSMGVCYFHLAAVNAGTLIAGSQRNIIFNITADAPAITSISHPVDMQPPPLPRDFSAALIFTDVPIIPVRYYYVLNALPGTLPDPSCLSFTGSSITLPGNAPGVHWFHAAAEDRKGNLSATGHYTFEVREASAPAVSCITHPNEQINYPETTVTFTWTDPDGLAVKYYYVFDELPYTIPTGNSNLTAMVAKTFGSVPEGYHFFHIRSMDSYGFLSGTAHRRVNVISGADPCAPDIFPPAITLVGDAAITVECGSVYTDAGATAEDECDGTLVVAVSGTMNTAAPGVYTLQYNVSDAASNPATEVVRTVTVEDGTAPIVTIASGNTLSGSCGVPITLPSATAQDACDGTVSAAITDLGGLNTSQPTVGVYNVVYSASDAADHTGRTTLTVTISDTTAPVIALTGNASITVECGGSYTDAGATATDACDGAVTVTTTGAVNTAVPDVYTLRYNASDAAGNPATEVTRTVTVQDTTPPVVTITGGNTLSGECGVSLILPDATAQDACDGVVSATATDLDGLNTSHPAVGVYDVVYSAQDAADHTGTATLTVTITDATAPEITLNGDTAVTVECGTAYADAGATAMDACDGDLTVSVTGAVNTAIPGAYILRYNASDAAGNPAEEVARTVTVQDTTPPLITRTGEAAVTVECGVPYTDPGATATDACDGAVAVSTVNPVNTSVPDTYIVRYNAVDSGSRAATEVTRTVIVQDTTKPIITQCPANQSIATDESCQGTVPDFTGGIVASDNCTEATALVITQTPTAGVTVSAGNHTITLSVRDSANNINTCTAMFTVSETIAPMITHCAPDRYADADGTCQAAVPDFTEDVQATDNCTDIEELTLTQAPEAGVLLGLGAHTITITVHDAAGNTDDCTASFIISDASGPVVTITDGNTWSGQCGIPLILPEATAVDACDGETSAAITDWGGLDMDHPAVGIYEVVYSARDTTDHTGTATLTVTISDTTAPEITLIGNASVTVECGSAYTDAGATATDACDGDLTVIATGTVDITTPEVYTLQYNVSDVAENPAVEVTRTVTVQDTTPPVITQCAPAREGVEANVDGFAPVPDFTKNMAAEDNCTAVTDLIITQTPAAGTMVEVGAHVITLTVSDASGNNVACETSLTVEQWPWRFGDANLDGIIDSNDITEIMRLIAGGAPAREESRITADVTRDGKFTEADMLAVFSYVRSGGIVSEVPKELMAQSGVNEIVLLWVPVPHDNVRGYIVQRRTGADGSWERLPEVSDAVCYDQDIESLQYYYRVAVVDMLGNVEEFSEPPVEVLGNTLTLWAPAAFGRAGDTVVAPISVSSTRGLNPKNVSITIHYDAAQAEFLEVLTTVLSDPLEYITETSLNKLTIIATAPGGKLPVGEGRFFDLSMRLKSDAAQGCRDTFLSDVVILNDASRQVDAQLQAGEFCAGEALWGDVTGDGRVDLDDAQRLLEFAVRLETPTPNQRRWGDMNGDRRLDAADAVLITRLAQNYSINPVQKPQKNGTAVFNDRRVYFGDSLVVPAYCSLVVPVMMDDARAVAGMDLVLSFTRYDLECTAVCPSPVTAGFPFKSTLAAGYARISFSNALAMPSGETVLAYLIFTAVGQPTGEVNPAPKVRINYAELKGELGQSFRWYADVAREEAEIVILPETPCDAVPDCDELAQPAEEGEDPIEGEGEDEPAVIEGEGEEEGEATVPSTEGEGEGELADEDEGGCLSGCGCKGKLLDAPRKMLGDWLLVGLALVMLRKAV